MGHKCYISFKTEDEYYKTEIQKWVDDNKIDMIDKSLDDAIDSEDEDYIMRKIREDYLSDSTLTIFLIGSHSSESLGEEEQKYIKRELQASLYDGKEGNSRNGILGVVLPDMYSAIYKGQYICSECGENHNAVYINNSTVIKEFSANYYLNNQFDGAFKGAHSILGLSSIGFANPFVAKAYQNFALRWIYGGQKIWDAYYIAALNYVYTQGGYDYEPKIVYRYGYINGNFFDPWEERFLNVYKGPVFFNNDYDGIGSRWITLGSPTY